MADGIGSPFAGFRAMGRRGGTFSPLSLFSGGESGLWYDPSPTTCWQDASATTPAGVGDPVGFLLDQSQGAGVSGGEFTGLGADVHTDPDFNDSDSWLLFPDQWTVSGGVATLVDPGLRYSLEAAGGASLAVGTAYLVTVNVTNDGGLGVSVRDDDAGIVYGPFSAGTSRFVVTASGTNPLQLRPFTLGTGTIVVESFSCEELPGHHATQPIATARPTLGQDASGAYYLDYDGIDDWLSLSGTWATDMSIVFGLSPHLTDTDLQILFAGQSDVPPYLFLYEDGSTVEQISRDAGSPTFAFNNSTFTGTTRGELFDAITAAAPSVCEITGADMATDPEWNVMQISGYRGTATIFGSYRGKIYSIVMRENLSVGERIATRRYVASATGVSL